MADLLELNSSGVCSRCGGVVTNPPSRRGCSLATLVKVHEESCPGVFRGKRQQQPKAAEGES